MNLSEHRLLLDEICTKGLEMFGVLRRVVSTKALNEVQGSQKIRGEEPVTRIVSSKDQPG